MMQQFSMNKTLNIHTACVKNAYWINLHHSQEQYSLIFRDSARNLSFSSSKSRKKLCLLNQNTKSSNLVRLNLSITNNSS